MKKSLLTIFLIQLILLLGGLFPSDAHGAGLPINHSEGETEVSIHVSPHLLLSETLTTISSNTNDYPKGRAIVERSDFAEEEEEENGDSEKEIKHNLHVLQSSFLQALRSLYKESRITLHYTCTLEGTQTNKKYLLVQVFRI